MVSFIDDICVDCLLVILKNCDLKTVGKLRFTSKFFNKFVDENEALIYESFVKKYFGFTTKPKICTWKNFYYTCENINLNGKWDINNEMFMPEGLRVEQNYDADIYFENNKFTAGGKVKNNTLDIPDLCFRMFGEIYPANKMKIKGSVYFIIQNNRVIGKSNYEGEVNVLTLHIDKQLKISGHYNYDSIGNDFTINGTTEGIKLSMN